MKKFFYEPKRGEKILFTPNPKVDFTSTNILLKRIMKMIERDDKLKQIFGDEFK